MTSLFAIYCILSLIFWPQVFKEIIFFPIGQNIISHKKDVRVWRCSSVKTAQFTVDQFWILLPMTSYWVMIFHDFMLSLIFWLSLAPSDLMLWEISWMRNESDFSIVSGSHWPNARGDATMRDESDFSIVSGSKWPNARGGVENA